MFKNITLEMSAKPFKKADRATMEQVVTRLFTLYTPLVKDAACVSVMLWLSDGSEILDYKGDMTEVVEWGRYVGCANRPPWMTEAWLDREDPNRENVHASPTLYHRDPPTFTYAHVRQMVEVIKEVGARLFPDKTVRAGATFDPGPEFALSDFKYKRHPEICLGGDMGEATMVCSYATLHGDTVTYAAYPHGIPEGTSFGTFFGKQAQAFLTDLGFDYIWFSNGLGFGKDAWSTAGAVFDGQGFHENNLAAVRELAMGFWKDFRAACPSFPIEVRGTNMSMGIDMASDGVPLADIYREVPGLLPPPNSPWAALNGDFGLELMGHMSRIAEIPGEEYLFRFYVHDPWYANSPWVDRYNRQPHDIYMPMAVARIDREGRVQPPTHMNILSVDTSFGNFPEDCVYEPLPHFLKAAHQAPDCPSPLVWVYPFAEYSAAHSEAQLQEMFFNDWYVRNAINAGVPLSTVVSTTSFIGHDKQLYAASILLSPVPEAHSAYETAILDYAQSGGRVIFVGNTQRASDAFRAFIGVRQTEQVSGEIPLTVDGVPRLPLKHQPVLSGGSINTVAVGEGGFAFAGDHVVGTRGAHFVWLRGTNSADYRPGQQLLIPHDQQVYTRAETLLLEALAHFGYIIRHTAPMGAPAPRMMWHRHNGALIFSTFTEQPVVETALRTPFGAPILDGYTAVMRDGHAVYHFPQAERRECRVFVEQAEGLVTCREKTATSKVYGRRIQVTGLKDATVRFSAEDYCRDRVYAALNGNQDFCLVGDPFEDGYVTIHGRLFYEVRHVTGTITFSHPYRQFPPE
ncbi:MAG: hypothetical protein E7541_01025 [Ruminococcaceae bacterium]|nr:hypothetical protein [Oscillospiraceae bacterium]